MRCVSEWNVMKALKKGWAKRAYEMDGLVETFEVVMDGFGITEDGLKSSRKNRAHAFPRAIFCYLARKHSKYTYQKIADVINKNHSTVVTARKRIEARLEFDPLLKKTLDNMGDEIERRKKVEEQIIDNRCDIVSSCPFRNPGA